MRKLIVVIALFLALLGAVALGSARSMVSAWPVAAHTHLLADGTPTPNVLCGGSAPTHC